MGGSEVTTASRGPCRGFSFYPALHASRMLLPRLGTLRRSPLRCTPGRAASCLGKIYPTNVQLPASGAAGLAWDRAPAPARGFLSTPPRPLQASPRERGPTAFSLMMECPQPLPIQNNQATGVRRAYSDEATHALDGQVTSLLSLPVCRCPSHRARAIPTKTSTSCGPLRCPFCEVVSVWRCIRLRSGVQGGALQRPFQLSPRQRRCFSPHLSSWGAPPSAPRPAALLVFSPS